MKRNFVEHTVNVAIANGSTGGNQQFTLPAGNVIAVAAFYDNSKFPGIVRASIKNAAGFEVSQFQDIRNLRDREAGYLEGKKPLFMDGGQSGRIEIVTDGGTAFGAATSIDFVFVYEN